MDGEKALLLAHGLIEAQAALGNLAGVLFSKFPPLLYPGIKSTDLHGLAAVDVGSQALFAFGAIPYLIHALTPSTSSPSSRPPISLSISATIYHLGLVIGGIYRLVNGLPVLGHVEGGAGIVGGIVGDRRWLVGCGAVGIHLLLGVLFLRRVLGWVRGNGKGGGSSGKRE